MNNIINEARSSLDFAQLGELKGRAKRNEESALRETAQQFEAMFLQMMLKTMRAAVPKSGFMDSDAVKSYESMYDRELSLHLARKNSIGIADMLVKSLSQQAGGHVDTQSAIRQHPGVTELSPGQPPKSSAFKINEEQKRFSISKPEPSQFPIKVRTKNTGSALDGKSVR